MFIDAMADILDSHLKESKSTSAQLNSRCPSCTNEKCGPTKEFFANQKI
jgi:ferrochelatase